MAVRLTGTDVAIQLLECLEPKLRRDVTRNVVDPLPIEYFSETNLLAAIKALAVREENPKVARVALSRMVQDWGEPIRSFAARLRGQSEVCRFTQKCSGCEVINSQGEQRVADQLCIGLADADIQEDLLKDTNQSMTVEETIRFVEVKGAGKQSAVTITTPTSTNSLDDSLEDAAPGEAINSAIDTKPGRTAPHPSTALPPGTCPNRTEGSPATPPAPPSTRRQCVASVAVWATARGNRQRYEGSNAPPSALLVPPAVDSTTMHRCAGRDRRSKRARSPRG